MEKFREPLGELAHCGLFIVPLRSIKEIRAQRQTL